MSRALPLLLLLTLPLAPAPAPRVPVQVLLEAAAGEPLATRQQRVLDELGPRFRLRWRYARLPALAGWIEPELLPRARWPQGVSRIAPDRRLELSLAEATGQMRASVARAAGFTGAGVAVAVLDSGIERTHPDLVLDVLAEECFCSISGGCCPLGGSRESGPGSASDDGGHGTNVAGIVSSDGALAAPGVAPDAGVVALKVASASLALVESDVAAALDWLLDNHEALGVRVVNLSLGFPQVFTSTTGFTCTLTSTALAIAQLHAEGVVTVAASGNQGADDGIVFPACVPEAISVGAVYDAAFGGVAWPVCSDATTAPDTFLCTSNSAPFLDVLAPGWRIDTPAVGGGTGAFGGTSASSPAIAGATALLLQADPTLGPAELRTLLAAHGPLVTNPDSGLSFRRTDVAAALAAVVAVADVDGDGVRGDGDDSGVLGDAPCQGGASAGCDDNCRQRANADQADRGGFDGAGPDAIGDRCQCADLSGDGAVDLADLARARRAAAGAVLPFFDPDLCPLSSCGAPGAALLRHDLAGLPGLARQACPAALDPACGDGRCSSVESVQGCPQDCGCAGAQPACDAPGAGADCACDPECVMRGDCCADACPVCGTGCPG